MRALRLAVMRRLRSCVVASAQGGRGQSQRVQIKPGEECPPGHDGSPAAELSGAREAAAQHRRLPSAVDGRRRRASGAEGEVSRSSTSITTPTSRAGTSSRWSATWTSSICACSSISPPRARRRSAHEGRTSRLSAVQPHTRSVSRVRWVNWDGAGTPSGAIVRTKSLRAADRGRRHRSEDRKEPGADRARRRTARA